LNIHAKIEKEEMEHIKKFKNLETRNPLINRMNLLVQTPHEEEIEEYFNPPYSLNCNENGRLESNMED
jgi:hypothetical protein